MHCAIIPLTSITLLNCSHIKKMLNGDLVLDKDVVVQFYPWFTFYFPLCWGMVMYDNEVKTKGSKIYTTSTR